MDSSRRAEPAQQTPEGGRRETADVPRRSEVCVVWCPGELPDGLRGALASRDLVVHQMPDAFAAFGALCKAHAEKGPPPSLLVVSDSDDAGGPPRAAEVLRAMEIYTPRSAAWVFTASGGLRGVSSRWLETMEEPVRARAVSSEPGQPRLRLTEDVDAPKVGERSGNEVSSGADPEETLTQQLTDEELSMLLAPPDVESDWDSR